MLLLLKVWRSMFRRNETDSERRFGKWIMSFPYNEKKCFRSIQINGNAQFKRHCTIFARVASSQGFLFTLFFKYNFTRGVLKNTSNWVRIKQSSRYYHWYFQKKHSRSIHGLAKLLILVRTGISAVNIGGAAFNSGRGIKPDPKLLGLSDKMKTSLRKRLSEVKMILIGELSIFLSELFYQVHARLLECFFCTVSAAFAGMAVVSPG